MLKFVVLIIIILVIGMVYRLMLTSGGNFLFNMDNGRDMVDVREMVVLGKLRLIGPTSAIEGLFNGPAWYYLLAIPFILTGGDPYAEILMEIILWAIGGFFLLKLISRYGMLALITTASIWITSNYVVLTNLYAFNPNPVLLLTPLFIYLLKRYIEEAKLLFSVGAFFLGGLFFNFEMNAGVFITLVIVSSIILSKKSNFFKTKNFWLGVLAFIITLMPQVFFDLRHEFIMTKSVIRYLTENQNPTSLNPLIRIPKVFESFQSTLSATLMNQKILANLLFLLFTASLVFLFKTKKIFSETLAIICFSLILIPFIGYILLPVQVNAWHLGAEMASFIILLAFMIRGISKIPATKIIVYIISILTIFYALGNINSYIFHDRFQISQDPSLFRNEISAIDYVYKWANGKNFKVYIYLPSVYDYPYQYLFWWYGQKEYGYIPGEYAYSPNKPQYISNQDKFEGRKDNFSGLVFLIKEPDRIQMRQAWENDFKDLDFISKEMVGLLEIEIRRETF